MSGNNLITEDHTAAPTVFVEILKEYNPWFRRWLPKFGKVTRIIFEYPVNFPIDQYTMYALVIYDKPESVARLLKQRGHKCDYKMSPWLELVQEVKPLLADSSILNSDIHDDSILKMNDDCILFIFSLLNLCDQVKLSGLCSRLNAIGEIAFRRAKKIIFNNIEFSTPIDTKNVLTKIGKNIEYIHFSGEDIQIPRTICAALFTLHCKNLKILEFEKMYVDCSLYIGLMPVFKNLESLVLRTCRITDEIVVNLQNCTKLIKLDLSGNHPLTGIGLNSLSKTIIDLNLNGCWSIKSENFINLYKVATFKKLNVRINYEHSEAPVLEQLSQIESLEVFNMDANFALIHFDFSPILNTPNLKDLSIECFDSVAGNVFEAFERKKCNTLKKLSIIGVRMNDFRREVICNLEHLKDLHIRIADDELLVKLANSNISLTRLSVPCSSKISDAVIIHFIEKSKSIEIIDISFCTQFNSNFVLELIEKLKKLKRETRLELVVHKTAVCRSVKENPKYQEFIHLLKLTFELHFE